MTERPLRLVQITDTHLMADPEARAWGHHNQANLDAVLRLAQGRHFPADAVLATGDLVHDESEAGYRRLAGRLAALGPPVYALPGNHDDPALLARVFHEAHQHGCGHHRLDGWLLCLLDSHVDGSDAGHLDESALAALDEFLARNEGRPALVCVHHNPVPVGSRWLDSMLIDNGERLMAIVDRRPHARCLLWGHVHQSFDQRRGHVRLLATPATTRQFLPGSDEFALDERLPGYRWLELYPDGRVETGVERLSTLPDSSS